MARGRKRLIAGWGLVATAAVVALAMVVSSRYTCLAVWESNDVDHNSAVGVWITRGGLDAQWGSMWREPDLTQAETVLFERRLAILSPRGPFVRRDQDFEIEWWMHSERSGSIGIAKLDQFDTKGMSSLGVRVLLWPIAVIALGISAPFLLSARRLAKRNRIGLCPVCGYDMKGLAAGAGCPECGKAAATR
jgi:hypothetical protein